MLIMVLNSIIWEEEVVELVLGGWCKMGLSREGARL